MSEDKNNLLVNELANSVSQELKKNIDRLKNHTLGALAIDGHPWHKTVGLSVLVETDEYRKWEIGSWKYQYLSSDDWPSADIKESLFKPDYETFFNICAMALCTESVKTALSNFSLEDDFEVYISNPDDPNESNYCEKYQKVDKKKRKKRRELFDDLDEGLKDPESIVSLKYWYKSFLSSEAESKLKEFVNLELLDLSSNGIASFPDCLKEMRQLKHLSLNFNAITDLEGIENLSATLEFLHLRRNEQFNDKMNLSISTLINLEELSLGECNLSEFPSCIKSLSKLKKLLIFGNHFSSIPDWLFELEHLESLGLVGSVDEKLKADLMNKHQDIDIW